MQAQDLTCAECQSEFKSAASLLQHFALHVSNSLINSAVNEDKLTGTKKPKLPDLYPISFKNRVSARNETDIESDSGVEDVNPMKFCLVTMEDEKSENKTNTRKYQCSYCSKRFGWSTDLKRHILTHTGERPFSCKFCDCAFTRNFLLLKHQKKCHNYDAKLGKIPDLKPIVMKSRKQEKSKIKRKVIEIRSEYQNQNLLHQKSSLICSN